MLDLLPRTIRQPVAVFLIFLLAVYRPAGVLKADEPLPAKIRVLFIGNSYTYTSDIPGRIATFFATKGVLFEKESDTPGGSSLTDHWNNGNSLNAIRRGGWDYVVLQDQSSRPLNDRAGLIASVAQFDAEIKKVGARTLVYQTWPQRDSFTGTFPNLTSSNGVYINETYRQAAANVGATLVPVGTGWPAAVNTIGQTTMYSSDGSHPSPSGANFSACTFYRTISRLASTGLPKTSDITQTQANQGQAAADGVALAPTVAPQFNLATGTWQGVQRVTLTTTTPQATIYYTLDGTTPTAASSSLPDRGVVTIAQSTTLKALAIGAGTTSTVTGATYTVTTSNGHTLFGNGSVSNLAVNWPGNPTNLVASSNPGFETGLVSPWGFYSSGGPVDGTIVHAGAFAAQLATGGMQRYVNSLLHNTLYEASIWYRYGTEVASTAFTAQSFSTPSTGVTGVMPNIGLPLSWRRVSRRFTTDATATSVQLVCQRNSDTGSYDDLEFYKVPDGYELGMRFRSSVEGKITALRVWRPLSGPTSYTLRLWDSAGTALDQATVSGLSATGWVEAPLTTPRAITANATYTVSYTVTEGGFYQSALDGLLNPVTAGSLSTFAANNAVYGLARSVFPTVSGPNNYSADVRFIAFTELENWQNQYFTPAQLSNPALESTIWGQTADSDNDGMSNLFEYALELSPTSASSVPAGLVPTGVPLSLTFKRARADVTYRVERSDGLANWSLVQQNPGSLGQTVTVTDPLSNGLDASFLRLQVSVP